MDTTEYPIFWLTRTRLSAGESGNLAQGADDLILRHAVSSPTALERIPIVLCKGYKRPGVIPRPCWGLHG
jgi:hypothetical protein